MVTCAQSTAGRPNISASLIPMDLGTNPPVGAVELEQVGNSGIEQWYRGSSELRLLAAGSQTPTR